VVTPANSMPVAEVCRRVDGLPLAIELAAARCRLLSPAELAERLDDALSVLGRGPRDAPARQHTLHATVEWSHDLLSDSEQACFARFAAFGGGATVEAAETIAGADIDTLDGLVAKSLLARSEEGPTRLVMLETIRAYALERFADVTEADAVRERHYRYFLAVAQRHGAHAALWSAASGEHLARLDAEVDNLRAALTWALTQPTAEPALRLCAALGWYWLIRDHYAEAVSWIDQALGIAGAEAHPMLRARALCVKGWCLWPLGRAAEERVTMAETEVAARQTGDAVMISRALELRAAREGSAGRLDVAEAYADEALALAVAAGDDSAIALAAFAKAMASRTIADLRARVERAAALLEKAGDAYHLADLLSSAAYGALCMGGDQEARAFIDRAVPLVRKLDNAYAWMMLRGNFGLVALVTGDAGAARDAFREELTLCRELVVRPFAPEGLLGLGAVACVEGDTQRAARLLGAAREQRYDDPEDPVEERLERAFFASARSGHGADGWDAAVREGAMLSFEDAIAFALEVRA
jgi:tetratricopeptide (TPR) repeat protein